jgi:hypothetical protein
MQTLPIAAGTTSTSFASHRVKPFPKVGEWVGFLNGPRFCALNHNGTNVRRIVNDAFARLVVCEKRVIANLVSLEKALVFGPSRFTVNVMFAFGN